MIFSDINCFSSSRSSFALSVVRVSRCLLYSLLVFSLSGGSLVLGVSSAFASDNLPYVEFDGVYSYCKGPAAKYGIIADYEKPAAKYEIIADLENNIENLVGDGFDTFEPTKSICIGRGLDANGAVERGAGRLTVSNEAVIKLSDNEALYVLGVEDSTIDIEYISSIIARLETAPSGLSVVVDRSEIGAETDATNTEIMLVSSLNGEEGDGTYLAAMTLNRASLRNAPIKLKAQGAKDVVALLVKDDTTFTNSPISGEEGAGLELVILGNEERRFVLDNTISGSVRVVVRGMGVEFGPEENTYTGGTYVLSGASVVGKVVSFGTKPIEIAAGGIVVLDNVEIANLDNEVIGIPDPSNPNLRSIFKKTTGGTLIIVKDLRSIDLKIEEGEAKLSPDSDASTSRAFLSTGTTLDLGGVSSRTLAGLGNASGETSNALVRSGDKGHEGQLVFDVNKSDEITFDGNIEGITNLIKRGAGKQRLSGKIYKISTDENGVETRDKIDAVQVDGGELEVKYDYFVGTPPVQVSGSDDMIAQKKNELKQQKSELSDSAKAYSEMTHFEKALHDATPEMLEEMATQMAATFTVFSDVRQVARTFSNDVTGTGTLVKDGSGDITFTGNVLPSLLHVKARRVVLKPKSGGAQLDLSDTVIQLDDKASRNPVTFSLARVDTVIAGLQSGGAGGALSKATGLVDFLSSDPLPVLTIKTKRGRVYSYNGQVDDIKKIIIDGEGVQKFLFGVLRDATKFKRNAYGQLRRVPIVPADETIVEIHRGELQVVSDAFHPTIKDAPVKLYSGGKFVLLAPLNANGKFENPIRGGDGKGYGVVEFRAGAKIKAGADLSNLTVQITGLDFNLMGISESIGGLISDDENLEVKNENDAGVSITLAVNVVEEKEAVFRGRLAANLSFLKDGPGKQTVGIPDGYSGTATIKNGYLVLNLRGDMEGAIVDTEDATPETKLDIVLSDSAVTVLSGKIDVSDNRVVRILAPSTEDGDGAAEDGAAEDADGAAEDGATEDGDGAAEDGAAEDGATEDGDGATEDGDGAVEDGDGAASKRKVVRYINTEPRTATEGSTEGVLKITKDVDFMLGSNTGTSAELPTGVTVEEGAKLGGTGVVGGKITVERGGVLAPGNSIGELTAKNGAVLETGTSYEVESGLEGDDDWKADVIKSPDDAKSGIEVQNAVTLVLKKVEGAKASDYTDPGRYKTAKTIIQKQKGKRFGLIDFSDLNREMQPVVDYKEPEGSSEKGFSEVTLAWEPFNSDRFGTMANASVNQKAVGGYIDKLGPKHLLYKILVPLSEAEALDVLDAISGEIYAEEMKVLLDNFEIVKDAISRRMQEWSMRGTGTGSEIVTWGSMVTNSKSLDEMSSSDLKLKELARGSLAGVEFPLMTIRAGFVLAKVNGSRGMEVSDQAGGMEVSDQAGGMEVSDQAGGMEVSDQAGGMEVSDQAGGMEVSDQAGGMEVSDQAGGIEESDQAGVKRDAYAATYSYYGGAYVRQSFIKQNLEVRGSLSIGQNVTSVSRSISLELADLSEKMEAEGSALTSSFSGEVVLTDVIPLQDTGFEGRHDLLFRVDHSFVSASEFVETAVSKTGELALRVEPRQYHVLSGTLGAMGSLCYGNCGTFDAPSIALNYMLGLRYKVAAGDGPSVTLSLDASSKKDDTYVSTVDLGKKAMVFGLSVSVRPFSGLDLSMTFEGLGEVSDAAYGVGGALSVSSSF